MSKQDGLISRPHWLVPAVFVVMVSLLFGATALSARNLDVDLEGSTKTVSKEQALAGDLVQYTVTVENSGDMSAAGVVMTDTLPADTTYRDGSLNIEVESAFTDSSDVDQGVVSWTGSIGQGGRAVIRFDVYLDDGLAEGEEVSNTAIIEHEGTVVEKSATTTIVDTTIVYLPKLDRAVPLLNLFAITRPTSDNEWTVSWSEDLTDVTYELQQAKEPGFASPLTFDNGASTSRDFNWPSSPENFYCYRVRAVADGGVTGPWSNTSCVLGNYRHDFTSDISGWSIRREDTDDVENELTHENGDELSLDIEGRWDYAIASPLAQTPGLPYRVSTSVRLADAERSHSYGLIFGGDWDGTACPNSDFSSCFNTYYRLLVIYTGDDDGLLLQLKRIDEHSSDDNSGQGFQMWPNPSEGFAKSIDVGDNSTGFREWSVEVFANGDINVYLGDELVIEANDTKYLANRHFGAFSSTSDVSDSDARFDWFAYTALP